MMIRSEIINIISEYEERFFEIDELRFRLYKIIQADGLESLTRKERKMFFNVFNWYIDKYDDRYLPRRGLMGWFFDRVEQFWTGRYRVDLDSLQQRLRALKCLLREHEMDEKATGRL